MKIQSISYKTAQADEQKSFYRKAGDQQTPALFLLRGLKKLMNTFMTKDGTQIYGRAQFWKDLGMPFYGHTKASWSSYLPPSVP
jgi:hypothetical protein